ncbi:MAG: peptidyl-prolyl cis-trans isomerase, partial [Eubacteriales bacterium]|nr:peptidyl-prolyl cis-trans isomerase [Eubacteriales bacterium]
INKIFNEIETNTDFNDYSKEENVIVETNITLENDIFEAYVYDIIYKLDKGSTSSIIETAENFYIFKIKDIEKFSEEEIRQIKKEEYILMKKNEIYSSQIEAWTKNMVIEKNDTILNEIDIVED